MPGILRWTKTSRNIRFRNIRIIQIVENFPHVTRVDLNTRYRITRKILNTKVASACRLKCQHGSHPPIHCKCVPSIGGHHRPLNLKGAFPSAWRDKRDEIDWYLCGKILILAHRRWKWSGLMIMCETKFKYLLV